MLAALTPTRALKRLAYLTIVFCIGWSCAVVIFKYMTAVQPRVGLDGLLALMWVAGLWVIGLVNRQIKRYILDREAASQTLLASEARYRSLVTNMPIGVYRNTPGPVGSTLMANAAYISMLGFDTEEELLSTPVADLYFYPAERHTFSQKVLTQGKVSGEVLRLKRKDGAVLWGSVTAQVNYDADGAPAYFDCSIEDITERIHAQTKERKLAAKLKAIGLATQQISALTDPNRLVQEVVESLQKAMGLYSANLFLVKEEQLIFAAGHGGYQNRTPSPGFVVSSGKGIISHVAQARQPVLVQDITHDPRYMAWDELPNTRSELAVPIISSNQLLGVLDIQTDQVDGFDDTDVEAMSVMAGQLAVALENARLYASTHQQVQRFAALRAMDMAISSSFDLRVTLNVLLDQVTTNLGVDAACVLLYNPYERLLDYTAWRGFLTSSQVNVRLPLDQSYAGQAALERRTIYIPDIKVKKHPFLRPQFTHIANEAFTAFFAVPLVAKGQVKGVLEIFHRAPLDPDPEWLAFLDTLAGDTAIALDNASLFNELQRSNVELTLAYDSTLEGWSRALELRAGETQGHASRVVEMTLDLARAMGLADSDLVHIRRGALLHDIGKMGIPDDILNKPGPLEQAEWQIMQRHPYLAVQLLSPIQYLRPAMDIPHYHQERWDGSGYPYGLKQDQIPLAARIFAVVDVWDALLSNRPYRDAWPQAEAIAYIREQSGRQFDPQVAAHFLELVEDHAQ